VGVFWTVDVGGESSATFLPSLVPPVPDHLLFFLAIDGTGLLARINAVELVGQLREMALGYGRLRFRRAYSSATTSGLFFFPSSR